MAEKSITSLKGKIEELTAKSAELSSPSLQCFEIFFYFDIETARQSLKQTFANCSAQLYGSSRFRLFLQA